MPTLPDVAAGSTMLFVAGGRRIPMRAMAPVSADRDLPVLSASEALQLGPGHVEVATAAGLVTAAARVVRDPAGGLALRLAHGREVTQRREAVRGDLELSLRVGVPGAAASVRARVVRGRTVNVSAGGLLALLDVNPDGLLDVGARLPAELTLPSGEQVSAVVEVVDVRGWWVRAAFLDIEPRAREKLVRLVFTRERAELAQRRERRAVEVRDTAPTTAATPGSVRPLRPPRRRPAGRRPL